MESATKRAIYSIKEKLEIISKDYDKVVEIANANTGKMMTVFQCDNMGKCMASISSYETKDSWSYSIPSTQTVVMKAMQDIEARIKQDRDIHQSNLVAIENNKKLVADVTRIMENIGIKSSYSQTKYTTRGNRKTETCTAGWVEDLRRCVKTYDGIESSENSYLEKIKQVDAYKKEKEAEEEKKKQEKEQEEKKKLSTNELAIMCVKYGLDATSFDWGSVLEAIISKNKYLHLAHYLYKNRGDWSDGCDYAKQGIAGFEVANQEDNNIYDAVQEKIDNWDGDGRCFRDMEYGYDYIFRLAPEEMYKDYQKATAFIGN